MRTHLCVVVATQFFMAFLANVELPRPVIDSINVLIAKAYHNGKFQELREKYIGKSSDIGASCAVEVSDTAKITFLDFSGLFVMFGCAALPVLVYHYVFEVSHKVFFTPFIKHCLFAVFSLQLFLFCS